MIELIAQLCLILVLLSGTSCMVGGAFYLWISIINEYKRVNSDKRN